MTKVVDVYKWLCDSSCWIKANELAKIRIKSEYKRNNRLNIEERIEKIAIGYVGEFAFQAWYKKNDLKIKYLGNVIGHEPDNGDFKGENNNVIDVKTQEVFYIPRDDWRCEVTSEQINRPINIYVFAKMFTKDSERTLFIYGWLEHSEFLKKSIYRPAGTILKGRKVHYPKYDVTINELNDLNSIINKLK